jgi:methylated-DNA-[protein]-cysteine S-methyltransferase
MPRATFDTPLGVCAIAWGDAGLTGFQLPGARARSDDVSALPPTIAAIIARVQRHLSGELQDFADLRFDFGDIAEFNLRVLRATLAVKAGRTATYSEIAAAIGEQPVASRGVGAALGANRWPLLIPCHRITGAHGKMTGFSGPGGIDTKVKLLALDGAQLL